MIKETEEEIRKIAIVRRFPNDYMEHEDLSDPSRCTIITQIFEKSAKQCAEKDEKDILCNIRRRNFILCEAIRREVESMRNPVIEGEKEVEK
ncbi:hypothetical protein LguiA_018610 [Lonicera macranthoides]